MISIRDNPMQRGRILSDPHGHPLAIAAGSMITGATTTLEIADTFRSRLLGLIVGPPRPLLLLDTRMIHTFGMRYPIDACFLDRDGDPLHTVRHLRPKRIAGHLRARHTLEVPPTISEATLQRLLDLARREIRARSQRMT
ncbi:MAG: DUF192 domain-containing protein [Candidatus Dadabacteria bacterium]|nr:MAG: DUF192 domain-containing protein [Candidatus Dadabacteria bacterium]